MGAGAGANAATDAAACGGTLAGGDVGAGGIGSDFTNVEGPGASLTAFTAGVLLGLGLADTAAGGTDDADFAAGDVVLAAPGGGVLICVLTTAPLSSTQITVW